jgi:hypothetical protein
MPPTKANLCPSIHQTLLETKKQSSINVMQRSVKCIGLTSIFEETLKGNIKIYLHTLEGRNLKNKKIYVNALLNFYKCVNYDPTEMEFLTKYFTQQCSTTDRKRKEAKERSDETHWFRYNWDDLQETYQMWKRSYENSKSLFHLHNWLIVALYSDQSFGAKRPIDICNLKRSHIKGDRICFTAQKNNFNYESQPLSEHILEPLREVLKQTKGEALIVNTNSGRAHTPDTFYKRFKVAIGDDDINAQKIRRLWASYKYSHHPSARELLRHSYELNHNPTTHLEDYVMPYKTMRLISTHKYRKVTSTKYVRC